MQETSTQSDERSGRRTESNSLDWRIVRLWRLQIAIVSLIILAGLSVGFSVVIWRVSVPWVEWTAIGIWLAIAIVFCWWTVWFPRMAFDRWQVRWNPSWVDIRQGVFFRQTVTIPVSRLQHVDIKQGPLARYWSLANLVLYTAGTSNASQTVPGLNVEVANRIRDALIEIAEHRREYIAEDSS